MTQSQKALFGFLVLVTVTSISAAAFYANKAKTVVASQDSANAAAAEAEAKSLVATVGKVMVLPSGETPTIATVADPEKLKDQPFFAQAQVGDKVLIYPGAQKAILWNPSLSKIVEVSALTIAAPQQNAPAAATTTRRTQ